MKITIFSKVSSSVVVAAERTVNEPAKSKLVNAAVIVFLVIATCGASYYVIKLLEVFK